jgi:transcriptional regulator with XRE-family HTH domain
LLFQHQRRSTIYTKFHSRRLALGLTQTQLADLIGVHQTRISAWDRGAARADGPKKPIIRKRVEKALGAPIEVLMQNDDAPKDAAAGSNTEKHQNAKRIKAVSYA